MIGYAQRPAGNGKKPCWPPQLPVSQVRVARPTNRLEEVVHFYSELLGLAKLGGFEDHDGYDGVFIGLPDYRYHLEFTRHRDSNPCPAPSRDHLLVLYLADWAAVRRTAIFLAAQGYPALEPENPYWRKTGAVTVADPDGWRVVLTVDPAAAKPQTSRLGDL